MNNKPEKIGLEDHTTCDRKTKPLIQHQAACNHDDEPAEGRSLGTLFGTFTEEEAAGSVTNWRRLALIISLVSIVIILVLGVAALITSQLSDSSAELAFAFDALLGLASSTCVMWRFYKELVPCEVPSKEKRACVVTAVGLVLSAIVMITRSVYFLVNQVQPLDSITIIIISTVGFLCYTLLFYVKFKVAQNLQSVALRTDSYDSASGAVMALGVLISTIIYKHSDEVWWLDPVIAIIVAMLTFLYGVLVLIRVILNEGFGQPQEYQQF